MTQKNPADSSTNSEWHATTSGDARLLLSTQRVGGVAALQMDFALDAGGGFVVATQILQRPMPEDYAVGFRLRGNGPAIQLEVKLIDATRRNVWRHVLKGLTLTSRWKPVHIESRDIEFAWGPQGGGALSQLGSIEIAIVGTDAASGTLWIADLCIEDGAPAPPLTARASSSLPGFEPGGALSGPGWKPVAADRAPWIIIDSQQPRRYGGLIIDWLQHTPLSGFRLRNSDDGRRWKTLYRAATAGGRHSYVYLPGAKFRFLRLEFDEPCGGASLRLQSFEFSRSLDAFWHNVAAAETRGWHPRWLHREQTLWTPVGTSNGTQCALMNADGMVEIAQGSFSLEPMLYIGGRLFTWTDVELRQELLDEWMPVPRVIWRTEAWRFQIQADVTQGGLLRLRYRFENSTDGAVAPRLFVLIRPFQVTPPWQHFRDLGGVSRIGELNWREGAVCVNENTRIVPVTRPTAFAALAFDEGFMTERLATGSLPSTTAVRDPTGFATGALAFDLRVEATGVGEAVLGCMALAGAAPVWDEGPNGGGDGRQASAAENRAAVHEGDVAAAEGYAAAPEATAINADAFDWAARIAVSQWACNGWANDAIRAALTATAHILVTRSGPALQPGPRRYTRSWIRDATMMSAALLRMGHRAEVREFIRWYAPHQRADGFVPCCVDSEGIDWLVEHDSHGQLIALIADYVRFSADTAFVEDMWSHIERAVGCIEGLIDSSGLLPISVSHEGYLAQPVHSYWDDFWALRGLNDARQLADAHGREPLARRWEALRGRLAASLFESIDTTRTLHGLDFIPCSVEWKDFDPTSTANAIYLLDVPEQLNRAAVHRTFDIYLADWRGKRSGAVDWSNYTPYEIRVIGAFVRLGRRDDALELLKFFLADRRPQAWNQWPEIAWRDQHAPAHLGDLPHTWISGEYVLAVRSLFAYERDTDETVVVAAGLAAEWIEGDGVRVHDMPTRYGKLSYSLRKIDSRTLRFEIDGIVAAQVILRPPLAAPLRGVTLDGISYTNFDAESVTLPRDNPGPAGILIHLGLAEHGER